MLKKPHEAAQTVLFAALDNSLELQSGAYVVDCAVSQPSNGAQNDADAERLWKLSEKVTGLC